MIEPRSLAGAGGPVQGAWQGAWRPGWCCRWGGGGVGLGWAGRCVGARGLGVAASVTVLKAEGVRRTAGRGHWRVPPPHPAGVARTPPARAGRTCGGADARAPAPIASGDARCLGVGV
jgi:hypothetical protein